MTDSKIVEELLKLLPPCGYPVSTTTIRNQLCSRLSKADQSKVDSAINPRSGKGLDITPQWRRCVDQNKIIENLSAAMSPREARKSSSHNAADHQR